MKLEQTLETEADLPPEYCHYKDEGCELAKSCLNCPFPGCIYDEPGGKTTPREFLDWGRERLDYFKQELKRLGRRNRAKINQLYKPAYTAVSKTTDYGP